MNATQEKLTFEIWPIKGGYFVFMKEELYTKKAAYLLNYSRFWLEILYTNSQDLCGDDGINNSF